MPDVAWSAVFLSLQVACYSVVLITIPGIAIAWLLARRRFWGKSLLEAIIHAPMVLPPVVTGYFLLVGLVFRWWLLCPMRC